MKITKFVHSCLLVETDDKISLFDPGVFTTLNPDHLTQLDNIFITHEHADHMSPDVIQKLQFKFPTVKITAPKAAVAILNKAGITNVESEPTTDVRFFDAPHEVIRPYFEADPPEELGYHYLNMLTHPGDSHSFHETMPILALPVTAPWGSVVKATEVALQLRPKYVIPIHDWHWRDEARESMYDTLKERFANDSITFIKPVNGEQFQIDL